MNNTRFGYIVIFILFFFGPLYSYIDPGTGSLLVSTFFGLIMVAVYSLRGFFYFIWGKFTGKKLSLSKNFNNRLVFYNEGKNYWNVFSPVIKELLLKKKCFVYLSSDLEDPGLEISSEYMETHYVGELKDTILFLNHIEADTVVMTTPQLGILQLKRSKKVRHYCHLLHAPVDIHTYKRFAFDYFDSVLCTSAYQIKNLRQLEKDRDKPKKKLYETGCTYYDLYEQEIESRDDAILLAPTWGDKSFFKQIGEELIGKILDLDYTLIFRPHPQSWISDAELLNNIIKLYGEHSHFIIDKSPDNRESLKRASCMICDISGIIFDFTFLYNKPVIAVNMDWKNGGYEDYDISNEQSAISLLNDTGMYIKTEEILNFASVMTNLKCKKITSQIINNHIFNFKKAGPVAAAQIIEIYEDQNFHESL